MDVSIDSDDVREQLRAMLALELFLHLSAEDQERVIAFLKAFHNIKNGLFLLGAELIK